MGYFIAWSLFLIFFRIYLGFRVAGRENIPKNGAFIFASNHVSYLDPILLGTSVYRSLNYMAREDLFRRPFMRWAMLQVHSFPVKRDEGDYGAIKKCLGALNSGRPLVIFPEGTRANDKQLKRAKPGIGFVVSRTKVPVIPAYIDGSFEALPRGLNTLKRHPVAVYIGKPVTFERYYDTRDKDAYQKIADEIMARIAEIKKTYVDKTG